MYYTSTTPIPTTDTTTTTTNDYLVVCFSSKRLYWWGEHDGNLKAFEFESAVGWSSCVAAVEAVEGE